MYYDMLLDKWNKKMGNILKEDNYSCMEISNQNELDKLMNEFPCQVHVRERI
jgi:hypothetical protein